MVRTLKLGMLPCRVTYHSSVVGPKRHRQFVGKVAKGPQTLSRTAESKQLLRVDGRPIHEVITSI